MGEPLEWPLVEEEVAGVAPELVEEALGGIAKKLAGEVGKVRALIAEIRRSMEFKKGCSGSAQRPLWKTSVTLQWTQASPTRQ